MTFENFKQIIMKKAAEKGIADYELYYETSESTEVEVYQHELQSFSSSLNGGLCLRCVVNGRLGYASTEELSEETAETLLQRAADNASVLESDDPIFFNKGGLTYEHPEQETYPLPETADLISMAMDAEKQLFAADSRVTESSQTSCVRESGHLSIYNSRGLDLHQDTDVFGLVMVPVVSDGTDMTSDFCLKFRDPAKIDLAAEAKKTVASAVAKLGGEVGPTAVCPVVFNPDAFTSMLAAFSGIFSSEATQKGLSQLGGREGEVIASEAFTLIDDPFFPESAMPASFDAEGSPTHRKDIIRSGRLETLLYNLKTAAIAGKKTTGNASKAGYDGAINVRPFTMYVQPGTETEEDLLKKAGNGVYIDELSGLHAGANAISGDFSLQSNGYLIENGVKTKRIKSFTVAGNFYELLKAVTDVADNLTCPNPMQTAFASPSILVSKLSVAGK